MSKTLSVIFVLIVIPMAYSLAEGPDFHYFYYKERISLIALEGYVAVFDKAGSLDLSEPLDEFLERAGYTSDIHTIPIRSWFTVSLGTASASPRITGVNSAIRRLIRHDKSQRYFFSPVFAGRDGGPVIVTRDILVQFHDYVPSEDMMRILRAGAKITSHFGLAWGSADEAFQNAVRRLC